MKKLLLLTYIITNIISVQAQISGRVIDSQGQSLEYVNVGIYHQADSTYIAGTTSDSIGWFELVLPLAPAYLKFSHMGYKEKIVDYNAQASRIYLLIEDERMLGEAIIVAERPMVNMTDGGLSFSASALTKGKVMSNALDVLGQVPGIEKRGDNIAILGSESTTIILNGRKKTLSNEQIVELLKSMPPSKVKTVELLYSAPPQYGAQGTVVNIVLDNTKMIERKAELYSTIRQSKYLSPSAGTSMLISNHKTMLDLGYNYAFNKGFAEERNKAVHSLKSGNVHRIWQENEAKSYNARHNIRLGLDHDFSKETSLAVLINSSFEKPRSSRSGFTEIDANNSQSLNKLRSTENLQSVSIDLHHKSLQSGVSYVYYKDKSTQIFDSESNDMKNIDRQAVQTANKLNTYLNHKKTISAVGTLSYGADFTYSNIHNKNETWVNNTLDNNFDNTTVEYIGEAFVGWNREIAEKGSMHLSLNYQYHKAEIKDGEKLWERNTVYPTMSFTWKFEPSKILQISLNSNKRYPSYWQVMPVVSYLGIYTQMEGNPHIRPATTYASRINYTLHSKYVFQLFANITHKRIDQMLYQHPDMVKAVYKLINLDRYNSYGAMAVLPFKVGKVLDSRLVLSGFRVEQRGTLEDIDFDRNKLVGRVSLSNTFTFNKNLSAELEASYLSRSIQGVYDIDPFHDLSVGVLWKPTSALSIGIKAEDLLKGQKMTTNIRIANQNNWQRIDNDLRRVYLTLRYTINGFKPKNKKGVDVSRFGV